ncbi:MAG: asparagine synthase (glutamine-hydrolyzing) [Fimbriimonadaceae bacterium]|nr:asparagine synthase (glutamine-hydrolyzing) [Fimbriimonadaceae bacterium]
MCGVAGFLSRDPSLPKARAVGEVMARSIRHRGPDDSGIEVASWLGGAVALAHQRLAIVDLSPAGRQPMPNEDGSIQLILNGEIYNFETLRSQLGSGHTFRSRSDTEVIVHGYEEWGEGVVGRLDGMFALALWDAPRQRLLLARDRFGKKPLFWARDDRGFYFASEIKAILAAGFKAEMAPEGLPEYLALGYVPTPHTLFRGIYRLPPASFALVGESLAIEPKTYWDWPMPGRSGSAFRGSEDDARRALDTALSEAVRKRLMSDVPLGVSLSGGVDSTAVALYAQRLTGTPIRTFTVGFKGDPEHDERPFADVVARTLGTNHTATVLEAGATPPLIETLLHHHDEPFGDSSALPTYLVSAEARRHVTVVLNGDGGDEVFAGYPRFGAALYADRIPRPVRSAISGLIRAVTMGGAVFPGAERFARKAALPAAESLFEWCSWFDRSEVRGLIPAASTEKHLASSYRAAFESADGAGTLNRILYTNARTYLLDDLLPKVDRMTMAHGLEARSPFLDTNLAVFAASLPGSAKWRGRSGKRLLKALLAPHFPPGFMDRKKRGFAVPLDRWFRNDLRWFLGDVLGPTARLRSHLNGAEVDRLLAEHAAGRANHGSQLWTLMTLELWLRKHAA